MVKFILITAIYLAAPGKETDMQIRVYPKTFENLDECKFVRDDLISQAAMAGNRHFYEAQCFGVSK
jgi:hypothetical protein